MNKKNRVLVVIIVILCSAISFLAGRYTRHPRFNPAMNPNISQEMLNQDNQRPGQNLNEQQMPLQDSGDQQTPTISGDTQQQPPMEAQTGPVTQQPVTITE